MNRRFVRTPSGEVRIKSDTQIRFGESHEMESNPQSANQFLVDMQVIMQMEVCSFMRKYIPGEIDESDMQGVDMSKIEWVYVIGAPTPEHMAEHLSALDGQHGIAIIDRIHNKPMHARVLLTNAQAQKIRSSMGGTAFYKLENGRIEEA